MLCCWVWGWVGVQGLGWGGSGRVVLIDNGRVYQSKAADALVQVKTTKFGTNVGLNMLLNISSRYFRGLYWSRQLRGLPSSDGYFYLMFVYQRSSWFLTCIFVAFTLNGLKFDVLMYPDHLQNWLDFGHLLLISLECHRLCLFKGELTLECQIERQIFLFIFHFLPTWPKLIWPYPFIIHNEVVGGGGGGGVYWFHSVHPSCIPCSLCSAYNSGVIHFIFIHLMKQL